MKQLFVLCLIALYLTGYSQDDSAIARRNYRAIVSGMNGTRATGYLTAINNSAIYLNHNYSAVDAQSIEKIPVKIDYSKIEKVAIRRKGATGRGLWRGALIGAGSGAIIGLLSGNDPPDNIISFTAGQKAIIGAFTLGLGGTIIGGIIGSVVKKTFTISGKKDRFEKMRASL